jgi:predicted TPR repeat methyltransferase/cytochrome c-type biogenesis protein CcmH/NrfG
MSVLPAFDSSMTVSNLLQQAVAHHQQRRFAQAQDLYRQVLALEPRQFDALHLLGVTLRQCGDVEGAIGMIGRAIAVDPHQASAHCNLGVALLDAGRAAEAVDSYDTAIGLNPGYAMAYGNRGNALRKLGQPDDALLSYDKALLIAPASAEVLCNRAIVLHALGRNEEALLSAARALEAKPRYAEAHTATGNSLQALQRFEEAVDSYSIAIEVLGSGSDRLAQRAEAHCNRGTALLRLHAFDEALRDYDYAIGLQTDHALAHYCRGNALRAIKRFEEAATAYETALQNGHDAVQIQFALASVGKGAAPANAPEGYVKELFDQYAGHFDQHLQGMLGYKMPEYIDAALQLFGPHADLVTIDLGCGTGLCADYLRPMSRQLMGVDLSDQMLAKARQRAQYDELSCADMVTFLSERSEPCDLVVAADVFVYVGDLEPVFREVRRNLRGEGVFCFSVEVGDGAGFTLQPSNRYAHSASYVEQLSSMNDFDLLSLESKSVRRENMADLQAYVVVLRRKSDTV